MENLNKQQNILKQDSLNQQQVLSDLKNNAIISKKNLINHLNNEINFSRNKLQELDLSMHRSDARLERLKFIVSQTQENGGCLLLIGSYDNVCFDNNFKLQQAEVLNITNCKNEILKLNSLVIDYQNQVNSALKELNNL